MATHKLLLDDVFDASYSLIAIHFGMEDYRLAYLLNQYLNIHLSRKHQDLDYKYFAASYSIFEWEDKKQFVKWNLVSNVCKREEDSLQSSGSLFNTSNTVIKTYHLIPELKNVDYFIKITNESGYRSEKKILNTLKSIPQIITSYSVDVENIKSKDNLIF